MTLARNFLKLILEMAYKRSKKYSLSLEDGLKVNDTAIKEEIKVKKIDKVTKASKKVVSKRMINDVDNVMSGSGAKDEEKEGSSKVKKEAKSKDLPAKRGRKAAKIENGVDSTKNENNHEMKLDAQLKYLPRLRGKIKTDVQPSNSVIEQNEPNEIKAKANKREKLQSEKNLVVKETSSKGFESKRKDSVENIQSLALKRVNDKKFEVDENRHLSVALRRRRSLDEMAKQMIENDVEELKVENIKCLSKGKRAAKNAVEDSQPILMENDAEVAKELNVKKFKGPAKVKRAPKNTVEDSKPVITENDVEELKVKNVKGPAKGKGKRAAKNVAADSQTIKKSKDDASKSKKSDKKEKFPDVNALDFTNESKTANGKPWNLKISTWNVNGIRAWLEKNGMSFLHHEKPDIMCIQETKCSDDKLPPEVNNIDGYHSYWLAGEKDGYSGVGLLSKEKPLSVQYGIDMEQHDKEGRVITAEYDNYFLVTTYIPNSGRGLVRLDYRQEWDKDFQSFIKKLDEKKPVVLCGDLNVAHQEIDLANPKTNKKNAGFTKEEREGFSALLSEGFVDTFRHLYPDKTGAYTFWTYMMNARAKNVGWRLDYFVVSKRFADHLCDNVIREDVYGSDHCPSTLFLHV